MKKKIAKAKSRKKKFIELVAQGIDAYPACIKAGYSENYAKSQSYKLLEKCRKEIEELKPIVREIVKEELKYDVINCFNEFEEVRELALMPDEKGNYSNLSSAIKAIENKGKLVGAFEKDNVQKSGGGVNITVASQDEADLIKDIQNVNAN